MGRGRREDIPLLLLLYAAIYTRGSAFFTNEHVVVPATVTPGGSAGARFRPRRIESINIIIFRGKNLSFYLIKNIFVEFIRRVTQHI
jgi:hypothetical protein